MARMYKSEGATKDHNILGMAHNSALIGVRSFNLPYWPLFFINLCQSRFPLYAIVCSSQDLGISLQHLCPRSVDLDIALKCRTFFFEKSTQNPIAI